MKKLKKNEVMVRRISDELVLADDIEAIKQTEDLILIQKGTTAEISCQLLKISKKIEESCKERVQTIIHLDKHLFNVCFKFSYGRYIEFENRTYCDRLSINNSDYYVLRLKSLSHYSKECLVMKIMADVFGL